jgi:predicted amidophosphoribosyltransferase
MIRQGTCIACRKETTFLANRCLKCFKRYAYHNVYSAVPGLPRAIDERITVRQRPPIVQAEIDRRVLYYQARAELELPLFE